MKIRRRRRPTTHNLLLSSDRAEIPFGKHDILLKARDTDRVLHGARIEQLARRT